MAPAGGEAWKEDPTSTLYDEKHIEERLREMERAFNTNDLQAIMLLIRNGLIRHLAGIGNPLLFSQTRFGSKNLIHLHQDSLAKLLWMVARAPDDMLTIDQRLSFCAVRRAPARPSPSATDVAAVVSMVEQESRHSLGKTALLLSGGAGLGMYHFGVIKALWQQNLLPRVMSGSSAGSIVVGIVGTMDTKELEEIFKDDEAICSRFPDDHLQFFGTGSPLSSDLPCRPYGMPPGSGRRAVIPPQECDFGAPCLQRPT